MRGVNIHRQVPTIYTAIPLTTLTNWILKLSHCPKWVGSPETALILSHIDVMSDKRL